MSQRTWTLPVDTEAQILADSQPTKLNSHQYLAEIIHIARPTAHCILVHGRDDLCKLHIDSFV